jgi:DNA-binding transcriptional ArsR family regulator
MKGQDLAILLKLQTREPNAKFSVGDLSYELNLSQSETSKGLKRLMDIGLLDVKSKRPLKKPLMEIIEYGLKYFLPASPGKIVKGFKTSHSARPLNKLIVSESNYVWPDPDGDTRGEEIKPLYNGASKAALKDRRFYELLALIDAVRAGSVREQKLAIKELKKRVLNE